MEDMKFHIEMDHKYQQRSGNVEQALREYCDAREEWRRNSPKEYRDGKEAVEKWEEANPGPGDEDNPFVASNGVKVWWSTTKYKRLDVNATLEYKKFTKDELGNLFNYLGHYIYNMGEALLGYNEEVEEDDMDEFMDNLQRFNQWDISIEEDERDAE